ncbi:hypothetical protein OIO90_003154 [Microbotryomycetes sp. JL221]|nr:hypothetical protein OIO90_003154 [Microbotryomycetes sp. JL221]
MFKVGILTVSDTAALNQDDDKTGPLLHDMLNAHTSTRFKVTQTRIVRDNIDDITRTVQQWSDQEQLGLILTAGGTGFSTKDNTPEAISPLLDKLAPGLVTTMLTSSLQITPMAALARPCAGVRLCRKDKTGKGTLIVTLPGSPKGAKENLESLLPVLPHALEQLTGQRDTRQAHDEMRQPGGALHDQQQLNTEVSMGGCRHHHHHHHDNHGGHSVPKPRTTLSQDPSSAIASRQRQSPFPIISFSEAIQSILDHTQLSPVQTINVTQDLIGSVLADDIEAAQDVPNQPTSNVDGYAVRATDEVGIYNVSTTFHRESNSYDHKTIYRINTGAPVPSDFDSIIMVEDTIVTARNEQDEELQIKLLTKVDKGENVRKVASDVKKGEKVLEKGDVVSVSGGELGTLGFVGKRSVPIYRRPKVAVLSTGNELIDLQDSSSSVNDSTCSFKGVIDSNRLSLISILRHLHYEVLDLGIVGDTMEQTQQALKRGKEECDVIVTTGGTSMGVGDLLKPCIEKEMGGTIHFGRVAIKPGKPTTFATLPAHPMSPDRRSRLVFALPGNPASALVTFFIFVLPCLRKMEGRRETEWELPRVPVTLNETVKLDSRAEYHRVWLKADSSLQGLKAFSTGGQRSSRTVSLAHCNGLLELPPKNSGEVEKEKGSVVNCLVMGELGGAHEIMLRAAGRSIVAPTVSRMTPRVVVGRVARPFTTSIQRLSDHAEPVIQGPGGKSGQVPTDYEQATGLERFELLMKLKGEEAFSLEPLQVERMGTPQSPIEVFSLDHERIVGCTGFPVDSHDTILMVANDQKPVSHYLWLRDHCREPRSFHPATKQRLVDTFLLPPDLKPARVETNQTGLTITWPEATGSGDSYQSFFPWSFLIEHSYAPRLPHEPVKDDRIYWNSSIRNNMPTVSYNDVMSSEQGVFEWLDLLHKFGFCLVKDIPPTPEQTHELIQKIAFVRRTHYGGFWDFTADLKHGDLAYSDVPLQAHTDTTYFTDSCGLQMFHLLSPKTSHKGGHNLLVDGFNAAQQLKNTRPDVYELFSNLPIPAHASGTGTESIPSGVFMKPLATSGLPVLTHDVDTGELLQIRWNNDDRAVIGKSKSWTKDTIEQWYEATKVWESILRHSDNTLWQQMQMGTAVIFDNHRVLHGRSSFTGQRRLCGAYVNHDDYRSRYIGLKKQFGSIHEQNEQIIRLKLIKKFGIQKDDQNQTNKGPWVDYP